MPEEVRPHYFDPPHRQLVLKHAGSPDDASPSAETASESAPSAAVAPSRASEDARGDRLRLQTEVHELKDLNRRLLKLQEINKAINSELDLHRLLEKILDAVLDLMDAERGYLILLDQTSDSSEGSESDSNGSSPLESVSVARNMERENIKNPETKISRSIANEVIHTGKPVLTTNAVSDDRFIAVSYTHLTLPTKA